MESDTYKLFPEIEPFQSGWYETSQGHEIYYEQCGKRDGKPVVFLHGGPGSGCNPMQRRFFDPAHYRIILLDQRGCGRSKPQGSTDQNTTRHLVDDLEGIRQLLAIETWLVFGGSWGSTLALAYAITFPARVQGLILRGIFLSRTSELNWFLQDVRQFYPEAWETLIAYLPLGEHADVLNAYRQRIFSEDPAISVPAATRWNAYESSIMVLRPSTESGTAVPDEIQLARARVQIHYIENECFVDPFSLLEQAGRLAGIPTIIVQGRHDMVCPPVSAWELKQAMPHAELHMISDAGHSAMEPGTCAALVAATERFKSLLVQA